MPGNSRITQNLSSDRALENRDRFLDSNTSNLYKTKKLFSDN
ncbi:MAG: hypothetical protein V7K21_15965 [Nostoc sp.]